MVIRVDDVDDNLMMLLSLLLLLNSSSSLGLFKLADVLVMVVMVDGVVE
jgi:hypothetical protein